MKEILMRKPAAVRLGNELARGISRYHIDIYLQLIILYSEKKISNSLTVFIEIYFMNNHCCG